MFQADFLAQRYFSHVFTICCGLIKSRKKSQLEARGFGEGDPQFRVHGTAFLFFLILGFIGLVFVTLLQYTAKLLLTLVVVEEPAPLYLPVDDHNESLDNSGPQLPPNGENRVFITSSIRKTLRHLRQEAGPLSPWRGLGANILFVIAHILFQVVLTSVLQILFFPWILAFFIGGIASMILVSRFALAVTHAMISVPLPGKPWYPRVLETPWSSAVKTVPALLIFSFCLQAVSLISHAVSKESPMWVCVALFFAFCICYALLVIPALIVLARVQASTLPDEINTIVPFDRTFGQDISLTDNALTVKGAIKSLDWPVMRRTLIFLAKAIPIVLAVTGTYIVTMAWVWLYVVVDTTK